jgi:hypothetical protein
MINGSWQRDAICTVDRSSQIVLLGTTKAYNEHEIIASTSREALCCISNTSVVIQQSSVYIKSKKNGLDNRLDVGKRTAPSRDRNRHLRITCIAAIPRSTTELKKLWNRHDSMGTTSDSDLMFVIQSTTPITSINAKERSQSVQKSKGADSEPLNAYLLQMQDKSDFSWERPSAMLIQFDLLAFLSE